MRVAAAAGVGPAMAVWTRATKAGLVELLLRERWVRVVAELSGESLSLTGRRPPRERSRSGTAAAALQRASRTARRAGDSPSRGLGPEPAGAHFGAPPGDGGRVASRAPRVRVVKQEAGGLGIKHQGGRDEPDADPHLQDLPRGWLPTRAGPPTTRPCRRLKRAGKEGFIREVTPYIKKPSLVSDLPWEGAAPQSPSFSGTEDSGSPKHQNSTKDRKITPLKMCFAARNLSMPDLENRLIELHSPDSRNTLILRCKDTATAPSWLVAIHTNIMALLPQVLAELNAMLGATSTAGGSKEVKHIAWLAEQAKLDGGRQQWRPVLMAVTEKDLLLYDCMPWTRDAWASPCHSYPLVATRLVHSGSGCRSPSLGSDLTFATRTGSRQGIEMHLFRVETHRDLSSWTRILVQGCHAAAELIKEVSLGCMLNGQEVRLTIHYENGFTISRENGGSSSILYRYPFERLKMSADDGIRNLYLDFGGPEGELTMDLHSCPKPIVFVLHTFLSAKVTRMGLLV
uniref:Syntrophin beta 2 n=1 Tax=Rhinopithecus bieti TaxID=61621 RepID=A0A2K6KZ76_RHIBE